MGLQDALRKAAGLLVELPPEAPPHTSDEDGATIAAGADAELSGATGGASSTSFAARTIEQMVRDAEGPNLDEIKVDAAQAPPPAPEGGLDSTAIYAAANLPAPPFSAEQMLEMLASLPPELPLDTKRQTVKVTLGALGKTVGATPDSIVADASRKIAALAAYAEHLAKRTDEFTAGGEAEIAALQARIEEKRGAIQNARHQLAETTRMCGAESDRLDDVLEFFSLDVPPSKHAAPAENT